MPKIKQKIYAVIVTWNNYVDTRECLNSILSSTLCLSGIVIVDNGSQDGSIEKLKEDFANNSIMHFILNGENLGFAAGVNIGIRFALEHGANYIFLLNNDAVVDKNCVEYLVRKMNDSPSIGITGPRVFYYEDPQRIWHGGGYVSRIKTGVIIPEKNKLVEECGTEIREVTFLTGCAMLIRREVFERVGFFEEEFFMYGEDVDFCLRATRAGFKLLYVPRAKVWHKIVARPRITPFVLYHTARNRLLRLRKNFSIPYFLYAALIHTVVFTPYWVLKASKQRDPLALMKAWGRGTLSGLLQATLKRPLIMVAGYYGRGNIGDEAILTGLLDALSGHHMRQNYTIEIMSSNPTITQRLHRVDSVYKLNPLSFLHLLRARWLIIGGGGILPGSIKSLLYYTLCAFIAKAFGSYVSLVSVGVNPVRSFSKRVLTKLLCRLANDIIVRDSDSRIELERFTKKPVIVGSDAFFLLDESRYRNLLTPGQRPKVPHLVVSLKLLGPHIKQDAYWQKWATALDSCIEEFGAEIEFLVNHIGEKDDVAVEAVRKRMRWARKTHVRIPVNVEQALQVIARSSLVISHRLHPALFASLWGIPVIVVPIAPKLRHFQEEFGWICMEVDSFSKETLLGRIKQALSGHVVVRRRAASGRNSQLKKAKIVHELLHKRFESLRER